MQYVLPNKKGKKLFKMKKLFYTLALTLITTCGLNAQDKFTETKLEIESQDSSVSVKQKCRKFNIGINIGVAWIATDVYVYCGFPVGFGAGGGTCLMVDEDFCKLVGIAKPTEPTKYINIKKLMPNVDVSKVDFIEITKSTTWTDEDDLTKSSIRVGKYPVDKDGNFEIEIITE